MIVLQGFELLPCDGVEASHPLYRLIVTTQVSDLDFEVEFIA